MNKLRLHIIEFWGLFFKHQLNADRQNQNLNEKNIRQDTFRHMTSLVLIHPTQLRAHVLEGMSWFVGSPSGEISLPSSLQFILQYQTVFEKYFWVLCGFLRSAEGCNPQHCIWHWLVQHAVRVAWVVTGHLALVDSLPHTNASATQPESWVKHSVMNSWCKSTGGSL